MLALLVFLVCMAIYLPTLSPSVVLDDGGEFQMVSAVLGVPHPTGYPLLMLLGWLFSRLPVGGDVAFRVTLLSTVSTAAAMALLYMLVRESGGRRLAAVAAALTAAAAPRVWMHAAAAEVYGLAAALGLLGLWLLLRWESGKTPLWAVALAFGFALTHHISLRLLGPAVLLFILAAQPRLVLQPRRWLPALACLLLPLALYLYVPLRAAYYTGQPELAGRVLGFRKVVAAGYVTPHYFGEGTLGVILATGYSNLFFNTGGNWPKALADYARLTGQQFPIVALPLIVLGAIALARRRWKADLLLGVTFLTVVLAALRFLALVGEDGDTFIPSYWIMAIWFGMGCDAILRWAGARALGWAGPPLRALARTWPLILLSAIVCAIPAYSIARHFPQAMQARQRHVMRGVLDQPLPQGAVLAGDWTYVTPLRYYQRIEGIRPDLWIVQADPGGIGRTVAAALEEHAPFYAIRSTPAGIRLLPLPVWDPSVISHPADVRLGQAVRWRGYDLPTPAARPGDVLPITLYWQADGPVGGDWKTFIHLIDAAGEKVAQADQAPGNGFYPPSAWQPGVLVADQYELTLDPALKPGAYRLIFGWYRDGERLPWSDGQDARLLAEIEIAAR